MSRPSHRCSAVWCISGLCVNENCKSDTVYAQMSSHHPPEAAQRWKGPAELVLAASVARRYYMDGLSKTEIADEYQLSRFKIARLLETARSQGLVRIEISHPGTIDVELSVLLRQAFHPTRPHAYPGPSRRLTRQDPPRSWSCGWNGSGGKPRKGNHDSKIAGICGPARRGGRRGRVVRRCWRSGPPG